MTAETLIPLLKDLIRCVEMAHRLPADSFSAGMRRKSVSKLFKGCVGRFPSQGELDLIENNSGHEDN